MAQRIGVLTFAVSKAGIVPLSNLITILRPEQNEVSLITDNEGYGHFKDDRRIKTVNIRHRSYPNAAINMLNYIHKQLLISYILLKDLRNIDTWIFFFNAETMVFPMVTLKLLRKKVMLALPSSSEKIHAHAGHRQAAIMGSLSRISYRMADHIIVYSPGLITEWGLSKYQDKIRIAHEHVINFSEFKSDTCVIDRHDLIGYIGRMDAEKGIMNFVKSIPEVLKHDPGVQFLIIGDGNQAESAREYIIRKGVAQNVKFAGWVPHGELPVYLNQVKLLVIPSYTEGLPNTMLEAMACGTPVLANPVGAIPDYVKDGHNGFILSDNSAERIAEQVLHILGRSDLENIAKNGLNTVESEFTYEASVKRYTDIISTQAEPE